MCLKIKGNPQSDDIRSEGEETKKEQEKIIPVPLSSESKKLCSTEPPSQIFNISPIHHHEESEPDIPSNYVTNQKTPILQTEPDPPLRDIKSELETKSNVEDKKSSTVKPIQEESIVFNSGETLVKHGEYFKPLAIKESEISNFLNKYYEKLPKNIRESYINPTELLKKINTCSEAYWLCKNDESCENFTVFCLEKNFEPLRTTILHASFIDLTKDMKEYIKNIVNYIWKNINCQEIRVELKYVQEKSEPAPCEKLNEAYTQNGFKWKNLKSDNKKTGIRTTVLGISRPQTEIFLNPRYFL